MYVILTLGGGGLRVSREREVGRMDARRRHGGNLVVEGMRRRWVQSVKRAICRVNGAIMKEYDWMILRNWNE